MEAYKEFRPTQFDSHIELEDREDWLVGPVSHNRDSDILTEANWEAFTQMMWDARSTDEDENDYEVHRFGHWGNGWFEIVLIRPGSNAAKAAEECEKCLSDYPVLDDNLYSNMEHEEVHSSWDDMSLRERIEICKKCKVSIFAARRDNIPREVYDYLRDRLQ